MDGNKVLALIDKRLEESQESGNRGHLGASVIGGKCLRQIWFSFHWAVDVKHEGQLLRLFNRGHLEEFRFEEWINLVSDQFWPLDPRTGNQIRISDHEGHFGGSLDGVVRNLYYLDDDGEVKCYESDFLTEFKTHNDASFERLVENGVEESKWEHYVQMQIYLHKKPKLKGAWYFAINKNNDAIWIEYVERNETVAVQYLDKSVTVLSAEHPWDVPRVKGATDDPEVKWNWQINSFNPCRFCPYTPLCFNHKGAKPAQNCRTCAYSQVDSDGLFHCNRHNKTLTVDEQRKGCEDYEKGF